MRLHRYTTRSIGPKGRSMTVNVAEVEIPELPGQRIAIERWEMVARIANLRRFGYDFSDERVVLDEWPNNGRDRIGKERGE